MSTREEILSERLAKLQASSMKFHNVVVKIPGKRDVIFPTRWALVPKDIPNHLGPRPNSSGTPLQMGLVHSSYDIEDNWSPWGDQGVLSNKKMFSSLSSIFYSISIFHYPLKKSKNIFILCGFRICFQIRKLIYSKLIIPCIFNYKY